jgi:hypothetical protein
MGGSGSLCRTVYALAYQSLRSPVASVTIEPSNSDRGRYEYG